jgi:hypothetical protein
MKNSIYKSKIILILSSRSLITQCFINNFKGWLRDKKYLKIKFHSLKFNTTIKVFCVKKYHKSKTNLKRFRLISTPRVLFCKRLPKTKMTIINLSVDLVLVRRKATVLIQILVWDWQARVFLRSTRKRFSTTRVSVEWIRFNSSLLILWVRIMRPVR